PDVLVPAVVVLVPVVVATGFFRHRGDGRLVLAGGGDRLLDELVVAAAVVDDQVGVGDPGRVLRGALVGVRVGGRVADDRLDVDAVAADLAHHVAPHGGGGDHVDLPVGVSCGRPAARRESDAGCCQPGQQGGGAAADGSHGNSSSGGPENPIPVVTETVVIFILTAGCRCDPPRGGGRVPAADRDRRTPLRGQPLAALRVEQVDLLEVADPDPDPRAPRGGGP